MTLTAKVCDAARPPASDAHSILLSTETGLALKRSKNSAICEAARPPTSDAYLTLLRTGTGLVLKCSKLGNLRPVVFLFVISITSSTSSSSITESNASSFSSRGTSVGDAARPSTSDADSTLLSTGTGLALKCSKLKKNGKHNGQTQEKRNTDDKLTINGNTMDKLRNGNTMDKLHQEKRTGLALKHSKRYPHLCSVACWLVWLCGDPGPALNFLSSFSASLH